MNFTPHQLQDQVTQSKSQQDDESPPQPLQRRPSLGKSIELNGRANAEKQREQ
jgi:hypothetical protein